MKNSFLLYTDKLKVLDALSDEQAGQLFKAIAHYTTTGEVPVMEKLIEVAFIPIKTILDIDTGKYENIVERNRANGSKGGRPRKPEKPKKPTGLFGNPEKPKKADTDTDTDTDTDSNSVRYITRTSSGFTLPEFLEDYNLVRQYYIPTARKITSVGEKTRRQFGALKKLGKTREDMQSALKALFADSYHQETRWKYCTPEFITRSDKFERFSIATPEQSGLPHVLNLDAVI